MMVWMHKLTRVVIASSQIIMCSVRSDTGFEERSKVFNVLIILGVLKDLKISIYFFVFGERSTVVFISY